MADIFLSYASPDRPRARLLAEVIEGHGWTVWWDRKIPFGKSFDEVIEQNLDAAKCVIVVWTKDSIASKRVRTEASEGARRGILIPVLLELGLKIPLEFKLMQAANLSDWTQSARHTELQDLLQQIAGIAGEPSRREAVSVLDPDPRDEVAPAPAGEPRRRVESGDAERPVDSASAALPTGSAASGQVHEGATGRAHKRPGEPTTVLGGKMLVVSGIAVTVAVVAVAAAFTSKPGPESTVQPIGVQQTPAPMAVAPTSAPQHAPEKSAAPPQAAASNMQDVKLVALAEPSFPREPVGTLRPVTSSIALKLLAQTLNKITDVDAWFEANGLALPVYKVPIAFQQIEGNLPPGIPEKFEGMRLVKAIRDTKRVLLVYGEDFSRGSLLFAYDLEKRRFEYGLNFRSYQYSPDYIAADKSYVNQAIRWAAEVEGVLYVAHAHNTYAKSSKGMNAYITAIDLKDYTVKWRSAPLIANAENFEVVGDVLITGYGFTAEPDFLYVLRRDTGEAVQKLPVRSGPEFIVRKHERLYVRTYDTNYVFQVVPR